MSYQTPHASESIELGEKSSDLKDTSEVEDILPTPVLGEETTIQSSKKKRFLGSGSNLTIRGMKSRHLTFIAIGGTIGTGIFLSAGTSVATAGAGGALCAYGLIGIFVYGVVLTLGEMSALIPGSGAFATYGDRFVSPALGFTLGWNYFLQWNLSIPSELIAASVILNYWTQTLQAWQWALVIIVPVFAFQLINVRAFGEAELWLSSIKVLLIIVFILVGLIYNWGGVIGHPGPGLSNFKDGPFFGGFAGFAQSFTYAFFSFGGCELVSLAAGETSKPHKSVPRAIKATFFRTLLFYIMTILVIGLNINHNDESLFTADSDSSVAASPITVVFKMAGFGGGVHLVNAVLLTAVLSATNSCFYASSRMLMSLAQRGHAPKVLGYVTSQGVPVPALLVVLAVSCLSFLATIWGEGVAFRWFINLTGTSSLLTWISIAFINLRFRRAWKIQGRDFLDLPFKAPFSPYLAWVAVILGALIFAGQGWAATTYDSDTLAQDIVGVYIGVVLFGGFFIAYWIYHLINFRGLPLFVPALEADFETGVVWKRGEGAIVREQDKEEKMAKERNAKPIARKWYKLLRLGRPL